MQYNEIIKGLREDRDLTQNELGKIFSVNQITISQYERGTRALPIEILILYAKYFKVSTDYILGLTDNPEPKKPIKNQIEFNGNTIKNININ